jgi:class 3 adenylate cyclase/tetratricopeptide (TPR) repeat protein
VTQQPGTDDARLLAYVPRLLLEWSPTGGHPCHMRVVGSLAFVDISGFTRLTERLTRKGKVGAEEMSDILDATFAGLLEEAVAEGADLVKWGGDAVLLLFRGDEHAPRAARAAHRMRATLRRIGRIETSSGTVVLRMSVGVHSGEFDFFLVGDPTLHRELLISGPGASTTAETEAAAEAGQIGLSAATASLLDARWLGDPLLDGRLLRGAPVGGEDQPAPGPPVLRPGGVPPTLALSEPLRAHILAGTGEAEHRGITVAFVQFAGTDALLLEEGPAALADALDEVVTVVQRACADHQVTFFESDINRDGGKIMLASGAPRSADQLEERMLRVARQTLDGAGRLPLRVGINRGHVFSGGFGPPFRRTYSITGDAINLAARLLGRTPPGHAVATDVVLAASRMAFRTESLPPFTVKGKSQPVHASLVGELVGRRADLSLEIDLAGRSEELAMLTAALDEARTGDGRTVDVVGEAGIGKTRLVTEVALRSDARVLSTRCEAYEASTAFYPFRKLLGDVLELPKDPDQAVARLGSRVAELTPDLAAWTPLLGIPLDLPVPATEETTDLDPQFLRPRLERLVVDLLSAALTDTTVIVVEDAQHVDDASADLLRRLARTATSRPWLLLLTRREQPGGESPVPDARTLALGPLPEPDLLALAHRLVADQPLTPHTIAAVVGRSGGNPLFLAELLTAAGRSSDPSRLPDSIESLVATEVDRLSPSDRRALRYAAVLGSVVDESVLGLLMAEYGGVDDGLLRRLDRFLEIGRSGRLRFRYALLRDVAYEGLPYRRRRDLHRQVGEVMERDAPDPEAVAESLSLHFFHAGDLPRAWRFSLVAARRALEKHAHGDAVDFLERAASSVPRDGSVSPAEQSGVLEQLADARFVIGLTHEAVDAYTSARRLVDDDPVREALLIEKEVRVALRRRRFPQAMRRLSRGLHRLEGLEGSEVLVARSLLARRYAYSRFFQGRIDDALRWAEMAGVHAEESTDKAALAQAYEMLHTIYAGSGRDEPLPYGRLALQANRELGDLPPQGHCLNNLAVEAFNHGRWDEALSQYRQAAQIFRRIGDAANEVNATYNQAELLVRQGRFDEAAALLPDVLLVSRAVEDDELVALALREQAQTQAAAGDLPAALESLRDARQRFTDLGQDDELVVTDLVRVETLARAGQAKEAGDLLADLLPPGGRARLDGVAARWHRLAALVLRTQGDLGAARGEIVAGLERAAAEEDRFEQALLLRDLVTLTQLLGEPEDPGARRRADELLTTMGVVAPEGRPG